MKQQKEKIIRKKEVYFATTIAILLFSVIDINIDIA